MYSKNTEGGDAEDDVVVPRESARSESNETPSFDDRASSIVWDAWLTTAEEDVARDAAAFVETALVVDAAELSLRNNIDVIWPKAGNNSCGSPALADEAAIFVLRVSSVLMKVE